MKVNGFNIIANGNDSIKKTFCVIGSARGGTSMVSGLLQIMGINMGDNLDLSNNEDKDFYIATQPIEDLIDPEGANYKTKLNEVIELIKLKNIKHDAWGWKDPELMCYFEKISHVLNNVHCIVIYRDPLAVAQKEVHEGVHDDIVKTLELVVEWRLQKLLQTTKYIKKQELPLLLISYERALRDKENLIRILSDFLNIQLSDSVLSKCKGYIKADRNTGQLLL